MRTNRDLIDDEIGTPPPSTVDVDAVMARQRRRVRVQRVGLVISAGAMTVAIVVVLSVLPHSGNAPRLTAGAAPTASAKASPAKTAPTDPRTAEAERLTTELKQIMTATLPGAQFLANPSEPGSQPLVFVSKGQYFFATATIKDSAGSGTINVTVGNDDVAMGGKLNCPTGPPPRDVAHLTCDVKPAAGAASMMSLSDSIGTHHYERHLVTVLRSDGNSVSVDVSNGVTDPDYAAKRPTPSLNAAQTSTVALDPALATTLS